MDSKSASVHRSVSVFFVITWVQLVYYCENFTVSVNHCLYAVAILVVFLSLFYQYLHILTGEIKDFHNFLCDIDDTNVFVLFY